MMISPEAYYEFELKGKTAAEIEEEIRILKKEISDLKYKMEDPDYRPEMICPSDETVLYWTREYLARAKMALAEAGGSYAETDKDRHAAEFLKNLPFLAGISFQCGSCFEPQIPLTVECKTEAGHAQNMMKILMMWLFGWRNAIIMGLGQKRIWIWP